MPERFRGELLTCNGALYKSSFLYLYHVLLRQEEEGRGVEGMYIP